jgi:copper ion binding protein
MTTVTYRVQGMRCDHCVRAVREEVSSIPGVTAVAVDLATGRVEVTSEAPVDERDVRAAIEAAGYTVAS